MEIAERLRALVAAMLRPTMLEGCSVSPQLCCLSCLGMPTLCMHSHA